MLCCWQCCASSPDAPPGAAAAHPVRGEIPNSTGTRALRRAARRISPTGKHVPASGSCLGLQAAWLGRQEEAAAGVGAEQASIQVTRQQLLFRADLSAARSCRKGDRSCSESDLPQPTSVRGLSFLGFLVWVFFFFHGYLGIFLLTFVFLLSSCDQRDGVGFQE